MRVAITGGTGLIGRSLAASLAADGEEALILTRRPERHRGAFAGCEVSGWDGSSVESLAETLRGADAVVHLAGDNLAGGRWTAARKRVLRASRIETTATVVAAIERLAAEGEAPSVLVQASAVGYYGPRGDEEVTEESSPGGDFLATLCRDWEAASSAVEAAGVRRVIARTGVVLSTRGGALPKMALPFKLFAGGPVGDGRQWVPWIHLEDEIGAIRFLLGRPDARGPYNLTAPQPVRNRELSRALGRALRRPSLLPAPAFALRLALGEMATVLLDGQRAVPAGLRQAGYAFRFAEIESALEELYR